MKAVSYQAPLKAANEPHYVENATTGLLCPLRAAPAACRGSHAKIGVRSGSCWPTSQPHHIQDLTAALDGQGQGVNLRPHGCPSGLPAPQQQLLCFDQPSLLNKCSCAALTPECPQRPPCNLNQLFSSSHHWQPSGRVAGAEACPLAHLTQPGWASMSLRSKPRA